MTRPRVQLSGVDAPGAIAFSAALRSARLVLPVLIAVVIIWSVPTAVGGLDLYTATVAASYLIAAVPLNILVGSAGVISMGTAAFALVGSYTIGIAEAHLGLGLGPSILLIIPVCALVGVITSAPALRLGPFAVAVVTLAYLSVAIALVNTYPGLTGGGEGLGTSITTLSPRAFWYVTAGVAAVVLFIARNLLLSPVGRRLAAGRISPHLAASLGIRVNIGRVLAFACAAVGAGLAGAVYPALNGRVSTSYFGADLSVLILLMVMLGGEGTVYGPVVGVGVLMTLTTYLNQTFQGQGELPSIIYGALLIVLIILLPRGLIGGLSSLVRFHRVGGPLLSAASTTRAQLPFSRQPESSRRHGASGIEVTGVKKRLGGVQALSDASITLEQGRVHGLIGPNGSGKTTLLNCISGFLAPDEGRVSIDGRPAPKTAAARSALGVGRTFQHPILEQRANALDNVLVGVDRRSRATWIEYALRVGRARVAERTARAEASSWLTTVGLGDLGDVPAGALPPGQQRLVELARALATRPMFLLMDEPAATLSAAEVEGLAHAIRVAASEGIGILLIDHNVEFVMQLCERITVLATGAVITSGTPSEVTAERRVIDVYLGSVSAADGLETVEENQ